MPAPAWYGIKGSDVSGRLWGKEREVHKGLGGPIIKVKLDDEYFIESLKKPLDKVVKGALAPMPPPPPVTDAEIKALLAYVKSLRRLKEEVIFDERRGNTQRAYRA